MLNSKGVVKGMAATVRTYCMADYVVEAKPKAKPPGQNMATATVSIMIG